MDMDPIRVIYQEDPTSYAGLWVALRDGYAIASAFDAVTLSAQPEVDDALHLTQPPPGD